MLHHLAFNLKTKELNKFGEQSCDQRKSCQWLAFVWINQVAQKWGLFWGLQLRHIEKDNQAVKARV